MQMHGPRYWLGKERRRHRLIGLRDAIGPGEGRAVCLCGWVAESISRQPRSQIAGHRNGALRGGGMLMGDRRRLNFQMPDHHEPLPRIPLGANNRPAGPLEAICRTCGAPIEPLLTGGFEHLFPAGS